MLAMQTFPRDNWMDLLFLEGHASAATVPQANWASSPPSNDSFSDNSNDNGLFHASSQLFDRISFTNPFESSFHESTVTFQQHQDQAYHDVHSHLSASEYPHIKTRRAQSCFAYDPELLVGHQQTSQPTTYTFIFENPIADTSRNSEDKSNSVPEQLRRHSIANTETTGTFCCPWIGCSKIFSRFYNLRSHYRIHSGERPYSCSHSEASFARNHDLKRHMRTHTSAKPFVCQKCNKSFSRNDAMNRHIRLNSCPRRSLLATSSSEYS